MWGRRSPASPPPCESTPALNNVAYVPSGGPESRRSASVRNVIITFSFTTKLLYSARNWITLDLAGRRFPSRQYTTRPGTPIPSLSPVPSSPRPTRTDARSRDTRTAVACRAWEIRLALFSRARAPLRVHRYNDNNLSPAYDCVFRTVTIPCFSTHAGHSPRTRGVYTEGDFFFIPV